MLTFAAGISLLIWYYLEPHFLTPFQPLSGEAWVAHIRKLVDDFNARKALSSKYKVEAIQGSRAEISLGKSTKEGTLISVVYPTDASTLPRIDSMEVMDEGGNLRLTLGLPALRDGYCWEAGSASGNGERVTGGISQDGKTVVPEELPVLGAVTLDAQHIDEPSEFGKKYDDSYRNLSAGDIIKLLSQWVPYVPTLATSDLEGKDTTGLRSYFLKKRIFPLLGRTGGTTYTVRVQQFRTRWFRRIWNGDQPGDGLLVNAGAQRLTLIIRRPTSTEWLEEFRAIDPACRTPVLWSTVSSVLSSPPSRISDISIQRINLYGLLLATTQQNLQDVFANLDKPGPAGTLIPMLEAHKAAAIDYYATYDYCFATLCLFELFEKYDDGRPGKKALATALNHAATVLANAVRPADGGARQLDGNRLPDRSVSIEVFYTLYTLLGAQWFNTDPLINLQTRSTAVDPKMAILTDYLLKGIMKSGAQPTGQIEYADSPEPSHPSTFLDAGVSLAIVRKNADDKDLLSKVGAKDGISSDYFDWYRLVFVVRLLESYQHLDSDSQKKLKLPPGALEGMQKNIFDVLDVRNPRVQPGVQAQLESSAGFAAGGSVQEALRARFLRIAVHRMIRKFDPDVVHK